MSMSILQLCRDFCFQQFLTMFGGNVAMAMILPSILCMGEDYVAISEVLGTVFVVSGLVTMLQTSIGSR